MSYHVGQLLLATPRLVDPNFARAVIFLLDHDEDGALGVVINRPSQLPLSTVLPTWGSVVTAPSMLFSGGPVAPESALAVGLSLGEGPGEGFKRLTGDVGLVDLDADPVLLLADLVGVRVFSGYAGWGPGSSRRSWSRARGTSQRRCRTTCSTPTRNGCGGRCSGARPASSPMSRPSPTTPR